MTYTTPCQDPANDPEDWFISRDGKQYSDDPLIHDQASFVADAHANGDDRPDEEILLEAQEQVKREALTKRRHAKDACHVDCYFRGHCLDIALRERPAHGTWGGWHEEELKVLYDEMDLKKETREALADADADDNERG